MAKKQSGLELALERTNAFIGRLQARARELQSRIDRKNAKKKPEVASEAAEVV